MNSRPGMQAVTYIHSRFPQLSKDRDLASSKDLEIAFDAALTHVQRSLATGMKARHGDPARPQLEKLERDLNIQRERARALGLLDREWFQETVRWTTEWVPDTEITSSQR